MNKFAQLLFGEVLFILETNMEMTELSTIFSPKTYWIDVTGQDVSVGDVAEYNEDRFTFRKPTENEQTQRKARTAQESLDNTVKRAALCLLTGQDVVGIKKNYESNLAMVDDDTALLLTEYYPVWSGDSVEYKKDYRLTYNGVLYKVLQDHTSQVSWTPDAAPSLFAKVLVTGDEDTPPEWQQPDSTNAYMTGDRVTFEGHIYESLIDNNVWSPSAYPQGWKQIDTEGEE